MKLAFVLLAIAVPCAIFACKTLEELDNCAYEISFLENRNLQVPTNDAQVLGMCARIQNGIKCLKDNAIECMKGPTKSIGMKIITNWENHFKTQCNSGPNRANYLKHIQCFADPVKAEAVRLCSDKHILMMEKVANLPKELTHGGACCSAVAMRDCVLGQIRSQCSGESGNYFNDMFNDLTQENQQEMCAEYLSMDQCNAKYDAATWKDLKAIYDSNDVSTLKSHQYKTIIPIIIKMVKASEANI